MRARALLGFAMLGEGNEYGPSAAARDVEHRVISGLGDRNRRPREKCGKIGARALDDHLRTGVARESLELRVWGVRPDEQPPASAGGVRSRPRGERRTHELGADRTTSPGHHDFIGLATR